MYYSKCSIIEEAFEEEASGHYESEEKLCS